MSEGPTNAQTESRTQPGANLRTNYRWKVLIMLFLISAINYLDRSNLSVAGPALLKVFHANDAALGLMLSAFSWSYAALQIPAGAVVDRIGPKLTYLLAMIWWTITSFLTALAGSVAALIGLRVALGVGEAPGFTADARLTTDWMPVQERGLASSLFSAGIPFASALGPPLMALLVVHFGWQAAFVGTGLLTAVWAVIWALWYRGPRENPRVSPAELAYIEAGRLRRNEERVPWGQLLRDRNVLGLSLGLFFLGYVLFMFIAWLPGYLVQARHFTLIRSGVYTAIPWVFGIAGALLGGWMSDRLIRAGRRPLHARKTLIVVGMLLAMAVIPAAWVPSAGLAIALLSVSVFGIMLSDGISLAAGEDVSPEGKGGSVAGILLFGGNVGGAIAPFLTGFLATATHGFVVPLTVGGLAALAAAASYGFILKDNRDTELAHQAEGATALG